VEGHRKRSTASYGRRDVSLIQVKPYLGKSPQATVVTSQMLPEVNHRLSPPYKSPQIDMGYDIFDFEDIHVLCDTLPICLLRPRRFTLRAARFPSWRDCCTKSVVRQSSPLPPIVIPSQTLHIISMVVRRKCLAGKWRRKERMLEEVVKQP
jgi:hypothetical protein